MNLIDFVAPSNTYTKIVSETTLNKSQEAKKED